MLAAVDHAVPDRLNLHAEFVVALEERPDDEPERLAVVGGLKRLPLLFSLTNSKRSKRRHGSDPLDDPFSPGLARRHVEHVELEGRRAAIDDENVHGSFELRGTNGERAL